MSSEESEEETPAPNGPKPRKAKKLQWERSKLKNIKARLDEEYLKGNARPVRLSDELKKYQLAHAQLMDLVGQCAAINVQQYSPAFAFVKKTFFFIFTQYLERFF